MQQINGRLTANAKIETVNERNVVKFDVVYDAGYSSKGEYHKFPVYYHCSYWVNTAVAQWLKKGAVVSVFGSLRPKAFVKQNQEADPGLYFKVDHIDFLHIPKGKGQTDAPQSAGAGTDEGDTDDLPF